MNRDCIAIISKDNLLHNIRQIRSLASTSKIVAVVKANCYGHDINLLAPILDEHIDMFAISTIEEAYALLKMKVSKPILVLQGYSNKEELEFIAKNNLHSTIFNSKQLDLISTLDNSKLNLWLKINTGMNRLGIEPKEITQYLHQLTDHNIILMSHFACADKAADSMNQTQIEIYNDILQEHHYPSSISNSAAIFSFPNMNYDFIRPGLALYGASPFSPKTANDLNLKPVMTLKAKIIDIKDVSEGDYIGYGADYHCLKNTKIAIVSCGYGDGYPLAPNGTPILVNNKLCPTIGRVSMDMLTIDISSIKCKIGDKVTLWGEGLPVEKIAEHNNLHPWQILTAVSKRVPRILR